jgi:hypothetical protein
MGFLVTGFSRQAGASCPILRILKMLGIRRAGWGARLPRLTPSMAGRESRIRGATPVKPWVGLHYSFGSTKLGPVKKGETEKNRCCIKAVQRILESEFVFGEQLVGIRRLCFGPILVESFFERGPGSRGRYNGRLRGGFTTLITAPYRIP